MTTTGKCPKCGHVMRNCELTEMLYRGMEPDETVSAFYFNCPSCVAQLVARVETCVEVEASSVREA